MTTNDDDIPVGFTLRHTLRGHKDKIMRIAWSPSGIISKFRGEKKRSSVRIRVGLTEKGGMAKRKAQPHACRQRD